MVIAWAGAKDVETTNFGSIYGVVGSVIFTLFSRSVHIGQRRMYNFDSLFTLEGHYESLTPKVTQVFHQKNSFVVPVSDEHCRKYPSTPLSSNRAVI